MHRSSFGKCFQVWSILALLCAHSQGYHATQGCSQYLPAICEAVAYL
jgi:hypothetical protein